MCSQLPEAAAAPAGEDVDAPCGHLPKGLSVCACQSGVSKPMSIFTRRFCVISRTCLTFLCRVSRAHWYLVVICFPGLTEPTSEAWNGPCSQMGKSDGATDELQEQESAQGSRSPNDSAEASPTVINSVGANTKTGRFDWRSPPSYTVITPHSSFLCTYNLY